MTDAIIDRELAIAERTDPFGNKWGIRAISGMGLYEAGYIDGDGGFTKPRVCPSLALRGKFTKTVLAEEAIRLYLIASWDRSDDKALKAAGKQRDREFKEEAVATN